jgi:hypothetical protein
MICVVSDPLVVNVVAAEILAIEEQAVELKCTVTSLIPVVIKWDKGGKALVQKESQ